MSIIIAARNDTSAKLPGMMLAGMGDGYRLLTFYLDFSSLVAADIVARGFLTEAVNHLFANDLVLVFRLALNGWIGALYLYDPTLESKRRPLSPALSGEALSLGASWHVFQHLEPW